MNGKRILQFACVCIALVACATILAGDSFAQCYNTPASFNRAYNFNSFDAGYGACNSNALRFNSAVVDYGACGNALAAYTNNTVLLNGVPVALAQYTPYDVALSINGHASAQFFVDRRGNVFKLSNNGALSRLGDLRFNGVNAFTFRASNVVHVAQNQRAQLISGGLALLRGQLQRLLR